MSPGAIFERVYEALKAELGTARFPPGEPLEPAALSSEFNASITPVRDVLHRLVGEGLVEAPRGDGFRMPPLTEVALRHIYAWNQWLLVAAVRPDTMALRDDAEARTSEARGVEELFLLVAGLSGNPEHMAAVSRLNERLRPVRWAEEDVLGSSEAERTDIGRNLRSDARRLKSAIIAYHRRRLKAADAIIAHLHAR